MNRTTDCRSPARRGMTLVVVMGLLAMTLAVSYAMLHWQATASQTRMNVRRGGSARQAALMGLSLALRTMSTSNWAGVDTSLAGTLSATETYQVSYVTGDPRLTSDAPDAALWPYRVTVTSVGFAADPSDPANIAQYTLQAVVQVVPKRYTAQPESWPALNRGTLHQWTNKELELQLPCQIQGLCCLQGKLELAESYPSTSSSRTRYLGDLQAWRLAGGPDYRPFTGPLEFPFARTHETTRALLTTSLGLSTTDVAATTGQAPLAHPGSVTSYRLYPGGQLYTAATLPHRVEGASYRPDPRTNPLGVFHRAGDVELASNATIEGLVILSGGSDLTITGSQVRLSGIALPLLAGETAPRRLPTLLVSDDLYLNSGADASATGLVWVWDRFQAKTQLVPSKFDLQGRLAAAELSFQARLGWQWLVNWSSDYSSFLAQAENGNPYFPSYMHALRGLDPKPLLTLRPDSSAVTYHWHDWSQPLIQPADGDGGLRWDLVDWQENP